MSAAFAQSAQAATGTQVNNPAVTLANNVALGSFLCLAVYRWAPTTVESCTVADNLGNTYTQRGTGVIDTLAADNLSLNLFTAPVTVAGACTATATLAASARFDNMIIHEISGNTLSFDNSSLNTAANVSGTDGVTSGTATVAPNAIIVGFTCRSGGGTVFVPGTNFNKRISADWPQSGTFVGSEDRIVDISGGTLAATWTGAAGAGGYLAGFVSIVDAVALAQSPRRMPLGD